MTPDTLMAYAARYPGQPGYSAVSLDLPDRRRALAQQIASDYCGSAVTPARHRLRHWIDCWGFDRVGSRRRCAAWARRQARVETTRRSAS